MKTKILIGMTLGITLMAGNPASSFAENGKGNGGDVLVLQFTGTMDNIAATIGKYAPIACAPKKDLEQVMDDVTVYGKPLVFVDGYEQDARSLTNDSGKKVTEISRSRLLQITNKMAYANLVLHEYYVQMGLEKTNQMLKSKECMDALSNSGINVGDLIYQINPITSIEEQLSDGRMGLVLGGKWGSAVIRFDGAIYNSNRRYEHSPILTLRDEFGATKVVTILPTNDRLKGRVGTEYDIETGKYTISVRYLLRVAVDRDYDGAHFKMRPQRALLVLSTEDHLHWSVSFLNAPGERGYIGIEPFRDLKFTPSLMSNP